MICKIIKWFFFHSNTYMAKLVHLKVNGHSFYDAPEGAIQVTWFRKNDDGYSHFLKKILN